MSVTTDWVTVFLFRAFLHFIICVMMRNEQ